jgi:hypothetical protein
MTPVHEIQGEGLFSPLANKEVRTRGVVTGFTRKGFFIQDPDGGGQPERSEGIFVFFRHRPPPLGASVAVRGRVVDYLSDEADRPTTQIAKCRYELLPEPLGAVHPVWLRADTLPLDSAALAHYLNRLEGMLVGIEAGATFIAPSNPFGDYVVLPEGSTRELRSAHGGVLIDPEHPSRWFPGFRILDRERAPVVNVGSRLMSDVVGPLNYRSAAYQIAAQGSIEASDSPIQTPDAHLASTSRRTTVLTLNGFNLDPNIEDPSKVADPHRDVDDDVGDGRFVHLAEAIVKTARCPDIVALQEIQDADGAEQTQVVSARATYDELIRAIRRVGGPGYTAIDIAPENEADGGQPGGNIRNGFLYNPREIELVKDSPRRLGMGEPAFADSRKVLAAAFRKRQCGDEITILNVHLASKRHQRGIFSPEQPGWDPRSGLRVEQAGLIRKELLDLRRRGCRYYVTGDFNDFEFSETVRALLGDESANLVETVPPNERYDYNHRGRLQVLMHGIVAREELSSGRAHYEILHGNELSGVRPGDLGAKPTDHAYVLAAFDSAELDVPPES